jgi:site-specific DNA recombinase
MQADEDKVSLEEQLSDIKDYCKAKGYELVAHYQDVGSGASKRRANFQRMIKEIDTGVFDVIVAWKSDRLSRGMFPAVALMEAMEGSGVTLEAVKDTIDQNTFGLLAAVGKIELDNIRQRSRMGHRGKVKNGTMTGTAKYGYTMEGGKKQKRPVINEAEAEVVRRIFQDYNSGQGLILIANALRRDGIPTRKGGDWTPAFIWTIITNPAYIGKGEYGRRSYYKKDNGHKDIRKIKWTAPDTWVTTPYPPIIDEETFKRAQVSRKHWQKATAKGTHGQDKFILKGRLWCGFCGRRYTTDMAYHRQKWVTAEGEVKWYKSKHELRRYVCTSHKHRGMPCPRPTIYAKSLEDQVWEKLRAFLKDPAPIRAEIQQRYEDIKANGVLSALEKAKARIGALEEQERRLHIAFAHGMAQKDYELALRQVREGLEFWQTELLAAEKEADDIPNALAQMDAMEEHLAVYREALDNPDNEFKAKAVATWLASVMVDGDTLNVKFRYGQGGNPSSPYEPQRAHAGALD